MNYKYCSKSESKSFRCWSWRGIRGIRRILDAGIRIGADREILKNPDSTISKETKCHMNQSWFSFANPFLTCSLMERYEANFIVLADEVRAGGFAKRIF